eukprot:GHVR01018221.1.p1 GENE.GHVR01018221.1~~GHVR01018221.1.p1  ORF type:complete len:154 (+),score=25.57 GHVR01018221.1:151-612(+)
MDGDYSHSDQLAVVKLLLDGGADVNRKGGLGESSPLHLACAAGTIDVVKLLVERGADVRCKSRLSSLMLFSRGNPVDEVKTFVFKRKSCLGYEHVFGWTPLHWASCEGHFDVVELLVDSGADLNCTDKYGYTPLQLAFGKRHLLVAELLKQRS